MCPPYADALANLAAGAGAEAASALGGCRKDHPCNKSPSAIAVTIVAAIADSRAAAIAGVRTYESVPLYADRYSGGYSGTAIVVATVAIQK